MSNNLLENPLADVTVTIKGMGLTISNEVYLIYDFLKEKGYEVEINDEYPPENQSIKITPKKIKIITNHLPWPG